MVKCSSIFPEPLRNGSSFNDNINCDIRGCFIFSTSKRIETLSSHTVTYESFLTSMWKLPVRRQEISFLKVAEF